MLISVQAVSVRYGTRMVLDAFDAEIKGPGMMAVMGPSGSGKSTLLSVIAGEMQPESGFVRIQPEDSEIDWIFQTAPILAHRTAWDNVALGPSSKDIVGKVGTSQIANAMSSVGILPLAHQRGFRLSGGERQRVAIARVLAKSPTIVLADEPTASLDSHSREAVCDALAGVTAGGGIVVIATHDEYVARRCSQVIRIVEGKAVADA